MKKVAIVYHYFAHYRKPIFNTLAGSEDIDYFFIGDPKPSNDIKLIDFSKEETLNNRFIPVKNKWLGKGFLWQQGLLKKIKQENFDAVIFLGDIKFLSTWIAMIALKIRGKKCYLWGHGLYGKESGLNLWIKLRLVKLSDGIFLYNNRAKKLYIKQNIPQEKLIVIYNSLDFNETERYRKNASTENIERIRNLFSDPHLPVVFCIGRLNKTKKIDLLIEALAILKGKNIHLNCFIIGQGDEKKHLEALVQKLSLEKQVHFTGALYDEKEISQYILSADLCVCPGPVGLTGMHSLSYGVPVISNDRLELQMPEHEAVTPGLTGDFYKNGDINDLAVKIEACILQRSANRDKSVKDCLAVIHDFYNPYYQRDTINRELKNIMDQ